jgi:hypothetical protein
MGHEQRVKKGIRMCVLCKKGKSKERKKRNKKKSGAEEAKG